MQTLTNRTRYRIAKRWFGEPQLVLQVEVHRKGIQYCHPLDPFEFEEYIWRDARVRDFTTLEIHHE